MIIGHRGARREAPENTLGGFRYLAALGIRAVEFDIRLSLDEQLMIIHDANCKRTSGVSLVVEETHSRDLRALSHHHDWPLWPHIEPTPLLSEVLAICQYFDHVELEIKQVTSQAHAQNLVTHLLKQLATTAPKRPNCYTITSFDLQIHQALRAAHSPWQQGLLVEDGQRLTDATALCQKFGCTRIGVKESLLTQAQVMRFFDADLALSAWTVNDLARVITLQSWGVHDIITDIPSQLLASPSLS